MRIIILCLLITLAFPFTLSSGSNTPRILDSVRPLSQVLLRDATTGMILARNICTVSSINAALHLWLTAEHCVATTTVGEDGIVYTTHDRGLVIDGHLVFVVKADSVLDLAVLFTPDYSRPALHVAKTAPTWEDPVRVVGHPWGLPGVMIVSGIVSNPDAPLPDQPNWAPSHLFVSAMTAPGNSGSPIINARGELISVLQFGWGRGYSPGGGSTYARLKAFAGQYFER